MSKTLESASNPIAGPSDLDSRFVPMLQIGIVMTLDGHAVAWTRSNLAHQTNLGVMLSCALTTVAIREGTTVPGLLIRVATSQAGQLAATGLMVPIVKRNNRIVMSSQLIIAKT